eukprot:TRINITY_DN6055_c0_g1_i8.p1 TRINITY_DN6055_c0_g1~~TRINITY_DN6055_c0_g1_i8.p1  ORF type:complete len:317 (-),score=53.46 TRINITY_DN6055_c0_g1_i8:408-1358(-)
MPNTILGVPGNLIDCFSEETCSVTKVGGSLWLPKEISTQFQLEKFQCCDIALSLIFQCHVPVLGKKRWLLVLGCTKCNNTWKVFRIQYDQTTPKNNTQIDSNQKQNQFVQKTDQNLLFQNIIVEESKQNQSGMDLSDLNSELDKLLSLKKNKQQTSIKTNKNSKQSLKIEKNEMEEIDEIELGPKIPSFYIHAIDEPQKDALNAKEKQHIDQLIKEYEQKETDEEREDSNNQNDEQWPDFGCEGIKVQRAHQPTSQCQGTARSRVIQSWVQKKKKNIGGSGTSHLPMNEKKKKKKKQKTKPQIQQFQQQKPKYRPS